jgi:hypothetical protein
MEKEFVDYNTALALKELGFDEPCIYHVDEQNNSFIYNFQTHPDEFMEWCGVKVIPTPTYSQILKWFRDFYNLFGVINIDRTIEPKFCYSIYEYKPTQFFEGWNDMEFNSDLYYTYEEAELECIRKLIEIVKKQKI